MNALDPVRTVYRFSLGERGATKWVASPRAEYYRIWMKVHGSTGDYEAVGSPANLDFTLEELPANATVNAAVLAVNTHSRVKASGASVDKKLDMAATSFGRLLPFSIR